MGTGFRAAIVMVALAAFFAFVPSIAWAVNIVQNPGFETGDFTDWTASIPNQSVGNNPHSGMFDAELGSVGAPGSLSQTLTTVPGQPYTLTYWLANEPPLCCPNEFRVTWNGSVITDQMCLPSQTSGFFCSSFDYTQFEFDNLVATGTSTTLDFGARQDPAFFSLDDVSVAPTPEPSTLALAVPGIVPFALVYLNRRGRKQARAV
jgi:flagellin